MKRKEFHSRTEKAFGGARLSSLEDSWDFRLEGSSGEIWRFSVQSKYAATIVAGKDLARDIAKIAQCTPGAYLLANDPAVASEHWKDSDVSIISDSASRP